MRILGIDPGLATMGYGIIEIIGNKNKLIEYGTIETEPTLRLPERLSKIYIELTSLIDFYQPDEAAFEELFFNKNIKTAITVAQARGVEVLACVNKNLAIYEYTPLQIKQAVVGYGRAEKIQVQEMMRILFNLEKIPKPDDAADGIAVAVCHGSSIRFKDEFLMR